MSEATVFFLSGIGGYYLGSIPFGLLFCYLCGYGDIRKIGSGNIGATNVLRTGNKWLALLTVIFDAFKAGIAAWIAFHLTSSKEMYLCGMPTSFNIVAALVAGSLAVIGHNFPIWLKFRGGKGVGIRLYSDYDSENCPVCAWHLVGNGFYLSLFFFGGDYGRNAGSSVYIFL